MILPSRFFLMQLGFPLPMRTSGSTRWTWCAEPIRSGDGDGAAESLRRLFFCVCWLFCFVFFIILLFVFCVSSQKNVFFLFFSFWGDASICCKECVFFPLLGFKENRLHYWIDFLIFCWQRMSVAAGQGIWRLKGQWHSPQSQHTGVSQPPKPSTKRKNSLLGQAKGQGKLAWNMQSRE